jgi:hypothetical protein
LRQLPQISAPKNITVSGKNELGGEQIGKRAVQNKGSGRPSHEPVHRVIAGAIALRRFSRCRPLPNSIQESRVCGRPFLGVSFRAFTASSNAEKGTPTAQPFSNRSIA